MMGHQQCEPNPQRVKILIEMNDPKRKKDEPALVVDLPPDWAIEMAMDLSYRGSGWTAAIVKGYGRNNTPLVAMLIDFATYIAQHEEPPVDPILTKARKLLAAAYGGEGESKVLCGYYDDTPSMRAVIEILKEE